MLISMGVKLSNFSYLLLSYLWSGLVFVTLLPEIKDYVYFKCVWKLNFAICDRFIGIEGGYRLTISIVLFYFVLSLATINCNKTFAIWIHVECWILKFVLFLATNVIGFLIPFSKTFLNILYIVFLSTAILFLAVLFMLIVDCAFSFRLLWIRKSRENAKVPTCYICTWLFLLHLGTSLLYAISLDIIVAFLFFNKIENCINSLIFLSINICLCLIGFGISCYPGLRDRQCSSQILFASILFYTVFLTWLALSDPENEGCNFPGTIFTGSRLESAVSFKCIVSMLVSIPPLCFTLLRNNYTSYIRSLLTNDKSGDNVWYKYTQVHCILIGNACFGLMSVTNLYEPVYTVLKPIMAKGKNISTSAIYFEGYNWIRFIALCFVSVFVPTMYIILLLGRILKDFLNRKVVRNTRELHVVKSVMDDVTDEFLYLEVSRQKSLKMLCKKFEHEQLANPQQNLNFLLLQCFRIKTVDISFWHFPKYLSQTYFSGRNGSNACTIISLIFGRFFARSELPFQMTGYLDSKWVNLFHSCIEEGTGLYDTLVKDMGVLDLCIDEVRDRYGSRLNMVDILPSLPVSFESEVESATILYQLQRIVDLQIKQVVLLIHNGRTSAFLIYTNGEIFYADSHAFGVNGALLIACTRVQLDNLVLFLKDVLGSNDNKLATLTPIAYEERICNRIIQTLEPS